jgi:hypothetical protein
MSPSERGRVLELRRWGQIDDYIDSERSICTERTWCIEISQLVFVQKFNFLCIKQDSSAARISHFEPYMENQDILRF